jgi:hypothetical protein
VDLFVVSMIALYEEYGKKLVWKLMGVGGGGWVARERGGV